MIPTLTKVCRLPGAEPLFEGSVSPQLLWCFGNDVLAHRGSTVFSEAFLMSICTGVLMCTELGSREMSRDPWFSNE